jgi:membrane fusion protein (multidrug efflux system)
MIKLSASIIAPIAKKTRMTRLDGRHLLMATSSRPQAGQIITLLAFAGFLTACGGDGDQAAAPPPLPVMVTLAEIGDVPLTIEMVGSTLGTQDVPIRARVEGFLETMNFQEGRFVKKGHLLYTIDPQPFQAKLVGAQSELAAARTKLAKAEADLGRIRPLAEMKAVSEQDLDASVAQEAAARAGVSAAQAGVDLAKIELSYTRIHAPIDGLIGLTKAKPGEFVGREPNPVVLNMLSDIDPIRVRFAIAEREYLVLARTYLEAAGGRGTPRGTPEEGLNDPSDNDLVLILADGSRHGYLGSVVAAAQAIDPLTGTYTVEASFPNPNKLLLPGQFARVQAPYQTLKNVITVPRKAIVELQGRYRVYVVNDANEVEMREVGVGPSKDLDVVIESGLKGGESVIVEGLQKVRSGMTVNPIEAAPVIEAKPMNET